MDCNTAEPFVSELYDAGEIPQEAFRHIMGCDLCQVRLQDYARITSGIRLLAAEAERAADSSSAIGALLVRRNWFVALGKSVRVPRWAMAGLFAVLAFLSVGWVHTHAQTKVVMAFWYEIKEPGGPGGGGRIEVAEPDTESSFVDNDGCAWEIEALKIHQDSVVLRIRMRHFTGFTQHLDWDAVRKELEKVTPQEITYVPGREINIPVEDGSNALLKGSVGRITEPPNTESKSVASLLPGPDEMNIQTAVLIRDGKQLLAFAPSAMRFHCDKDTLCGFFLYVPGDGLFFFSLQPLQGGIQGTVFMSQMVFREQEHLYTLLAGSPITGGEQPRSMWVAHLKDYLPSQHGRAKSEDAWASIGQGPWPPF